MKKKTSIVIGVILIAIAIVFMGYAGAHPEASFPWNNRVTFMLYGAYLWLIFKFLVGIPFQEPDTHRSLMSGVMFLFMAITFLVMELTGSKVDIYTGIRGFVVLGGLDLGIENIYKWSKAKGE